VAVGERRDASVWAAPSRLGRLRWFLVFVPDSEKAPLARGLLSIWFALAAC
jgi:hypothetical protein